MKVAFIGIGRMGLEMARRLVAAGHEVAVYNRTAGKAAALVEAGAKQVNSIAEAAAHGKVTFTMLSDDAAIEELAARPGGLLESLPAGGIHICSGTHGINIVRKLKAEHAARGQVLLTAPVLGRPAAVASGQAGIVVSGAADARKQCAPLFSAIAPRVVEAGDDPEQATAIKIANNFVLGCAIEAMGEAFSLVRKYGVAPQILHQVMAEGLFAAPAYKVYGKIIVEQTYDQVGQMALLGLKDANLALAAGEAVSVPLPSGNVWRDRLVGAVAHGDGHKDWAVMALEQARASGLA